MGPDSRPNLTNGDAPRLACPRRQHHQLGVFAAQPRSLIRTGKAAGVGIAHHHDGPAQQVDPSGWIAWRADAAAWRAGQQPPQIGPALFQHQLPGDVAAVIVEGELVQCSRR